VTREVSIVQQVLPQYRLPFFEGLRANLAEDDIRLRLLHGQTGDGSGSKGDERELSWAEPVNSRRLSLPRGRPLVWQPVARTTRGSDLVVLEHAGRNLGTWPLLCWGVRGGRPRVAFWGHGTNLQADRGSALTEPAKRWASRRAHWWFAYTEGSAERVVAHGFPRDRITVVNNTVETPRLHDPPERAPLTCVYVGALYPLKRISFLLEAGARLAELVPGFRLIVLGSGEDRSLVERVEPTAPWLDFRGATFDDAKAEILAASSLTLMPGLVGLAIVDAFAYGCPLVTTDQPFHSPEVEYLRDGENGVMLPRQSTPSEYAEAVAAVLRDHERLGRLREGCARSAQELSMTSMVERFADGVRTALEAQPVRARGQRHL
jgi:glycosyltransferase involved in cell wall biosynthesis